MDFNSAENLKLKNQNRKVNHTYNHFSCIIWIEHITDEEARENGAHIFPQTDIFSMTCISVLLNIPGTVCSDIALILKVIYSWGIWFVQSHKASESKEINACL